MKIFISIVLTALLAFALSIYLPWWSIAVAAFLVSLFIPIKPWQSFLTGFIALFLLWAVMAWFINDANEGLLASKVSQIILKKDNPTMLVLLTALLGGLVAGFASLTGSLARGLRNS
ncbi:hypothetical protein KJS94_06245 [Flavihumibacter rivuli]|uniref:hypothetical protein n=1 Tax=Flavihumibacter rivuli TaxID=2838156 RepID=UPI001BDDDD18|nr:hypothetical protein [Flavihumibacter rivuli]ULQ57796.1 hypothetical protein KJS94_06245 [Flavihumibacter rivuli]